MKRIIIHKERRYTDHGIGYTEHDGYGGTMDNRWSIRMAIAYELPKIGIGEQYQLEVNDKIKGIFVR